MPDWGAASNSLYWHEMWLQITFDVMILTAFQLRWWILCLCGRRRWMGGTQDQIIISTVVSCDTWLPSWKGQQNISMRLERVIFYITVASGSFEFLEQNVCFFGGGGLKCTLKWKLKIILRNAFLFKSATKQHTQIKIITNLSFITKDAKR